MKKNERKTAEEKTLYKKQCKYVGSVAITEQRIEDRQRFINEKIVEMTAGVKGIPVIFTILEEGVKVLKDDGTAVKMAHSVTRIMFSICQPEHKLFAYVAKNMNVNHRNIVQAHMFKTKKSSHTKELNASLLKSFEISYAKTQQSTADRKSKEKSFDVEIAENRETKIKGKRWAKQELAMGHKYAAHAQLAQNRVSQALDGAPLTDKKVEKTQSSPPDSKKKLSKGASKDTPDLNKQLSRGESHETVVGPKLPPKKLSREESKTPSTPNTQAPMYSILEPEEAAPTRGTPVDVYEEMDNGGRSTGGTPADVYEQPIDGSAPGGIYQTIEEENAEQPAPDTPIDRRQNISDANNKQVNSTIISSGRASQNDEILSLSTSPTTPVNIRNKPALDFVSPTQRFSTIEDSSSNNSQTEGYVNIDHLEKKNEPLPPIPDDAVLHTTDVKESLDMSEEDILKNADWFQAGFSRDIAETILADRSIGAFFVRASQTQIGSFVLTVKIPVSCKPNGIGNFLIEVNNGEYKLKGFKPGFQSLTDLVGYYGSCQEDIPVQLSLGFQNKLCTDKQGGIVDDEEEEDHEYEDPDYQYFSSADDMLIELNSL